MFFAMTITLLEEKSVGAEFLGVACPVVFPKTP